jgi:HD-GYP domain-containing protein (c-di-GMP phosphodiesterase class II)
MRVILATRDEDAGSWLQAVLSSAGLTVARLAHPDPTAPELAQADLLIADSISAASLEGAGPGRRLLLIPRGHVVDVAQAMAGGFLDLLVIPSPEDEVLARVGRAMDRFLKPMKVVAGPRARTDELKTIVNRVVTALKRAGRAGGDGTRAVQELTEGMLSVFLLMIDSHETTDRATPGHSKRTATLVRALARGFGMDGDELGWMDLAGRLHDIGLVAQQVPLRDAAPLSLELRRALSEHPKLSEDILAPLQTWGLPAQAIRWHHERIDGSGYPDGLEGDQIPVAAQILGAADAFEALTSPRPWRAAETGRDALEAMRAGGGFRADVLDALAASLPDLPGA